VQEYSADAAGSDLRLFEAKMGHASSFENRILLKSCACQKVTVLSDKPLGINLLKQRSALTARVTGGWRDETRPRNGQNPKP
jgi:hypothetical protein